MIPPLQPTLENRILYKTFINILLTRYESRAAESYANSTIPAHSRSSSKSSVQLQGLAQLVPTPHGSYILFLTSTLPVIPCNASLCHFFAQFSCGIPHNDPSTTPSLAWEIYQLASSIFGKRVCWWSTSDDIRNTVFWDQWYLDDMHRCMMHALEYGWIEEEGKRRTLEDLERGEEVERPPPVPPKVIGDGKSVVMTHKRADSGVSVSSAAFKSLPPLPAVLPEEMSTGSQTSLGRAVSRGIDSGLAETRQCNKLGEWILALRPRKGGGRENVVQTWHSN